MIAAPFSITWNALGGHFASFRRTRMTEYPRKSEEIQSFVPLFVADEIVLLFSKENENSTTANLHDMQCMWYDYRTSFFF